ncbi:MAG: translation initiation factor IF-2 [Oscillospiraceae bacterium]|nr:translation initiation factor IF-2 [Oscillospiraceae bacterium]
MVVKYKIHELAKDFNIKSNIITDFFKSRGDETKKSQTVLTSDELDLIFDRLTQDNSVDSFDGYFAMKKPEEPKTEEAAEEDSAPEKNASAVKEKAKSSKPAAEKKSSDKTAKNASNAEKRPEKAAKATDKSAKATDKGAKQISAAPAQNNDKPFKKKENKSSDGTFVQSRTKGERKTVNTRNEDVELDKYNERYENVSGTAVSERVNDGSRKQKIKQKSQQYNKKQGTRARRRETEAERLARIRAERASRKIVVTVGDTITVGELASQLKMTAAEVIKKLFSYGIMAGINESIDFDTAEIVATELGAKVEREVVVTIEDRIIDATEDSEENLVPRSPVVCVMGHVDHGKTSLLDAIRHTSVTSTESGGITQHIGAYRVDLDGQEITFLDTPGHAAFTEMRARGAKATDIAVLVVAADDGIMPQTIEAINHAKAAEIAIIVAINKMDKPGAQPDRVMQQLTEYGLVPEEWGGDTICVPVSAKTHEGIDKLLEAILLVAEMKELRANPNRAAKGVVIEARLDKGKGPIATLLVQNGTLKSGDIVVAGTAVGRIRVMTDYKGRRVKEAGPSIPVEVMGLGEVPGAGDIFDAVSDEKLARELVEQRKQKLKEEQFNAYRRVTLDTLFSTLEEGELKELNIVVKADVQGSVEALTQNLEKLSNNEVKVRVIHGGVGAITDSDVMLAAASNAIIVGFHVRPDATAQAHAERDNIEMRMYSVIYDCIEDVQAAIKGMLSPKFRDVELGKAEVRRVFKLSSAGTIAGSYVLSGKVARNCKIRVVRDGIVIADDAIASLKREKDDAKEVMSGYECGIGLEKYNDIKEGDILEAYLVEEYRDA